MGVSTDGILFYGIDLGEDFDIGEYLASRGLASEEESDWDLCELSSPECEIGMHCSGSSPEPFVCIKESHYVNKRGYPTEIPDGLTAKPEWRDQIAAFCAANDLPFAEPRWLLASMWW